MSLIPTILRESFELYNLPIRSLSLSEGTLSEIFGGACTKTWFECTKSKQCCPGNICKEVPGKEGKGYPKRCGRP